MLAVVFEGCANRAAFAAGVAAELAAAGVTPGLVAGASSGAIVAAGVAAGRSAELPALWAGVAGRSIVAWRQLVRNRSPFAMSAIVGDALRAALGDGDLRAAPGEALCTVTRVVDGRTLVRSSRHEPDFVRAVLGSCFIPILYGRAVRLDGALVVDGGWLGGLTAGMRKDWRLRFIDDGVTEPHRRALAGLTRGAAASGVRLAYAEALRGAAVLDVGLPAPWTAEVQTRNLTRALTVVAPQPASERLWVGRSFAAPGLGDGGEAAAAPVVTIAHPTGRQAWAGVGWAGLTGVVTGGHAPGGGDAVDRAARLW